MHGVFHTTKTHGFRLSADSLSFISSYLGDVLQVTLGGGTMTR